MTFDEPLVLDFSQADIRGRIIDLLSRYPKEHVLYPALSFSLEWLDGVSLYYFSTSGSTGKAKILPFTKEQIEASVQATSDFFQLKKRDKVFICLNTCYTGGKMMLARALYMGLEAHLVSPSNSLAHYLAHESYTLTAMVPSQLYTLFQQVDANQILSNCRNILVGGAMVDRLLLRQISEVENGNIYETFGMTETLSHIALKKINVKKEKYFFETLPGVEITINRYNCLKIKSKVTRGEWVETTDIVELIDSTHFIWKGRADNVINSGGVKIYPEELEDLIAPILVSLNYNCDFFLTSIEDEKLGEKLVLVIEGERFETENLLLILKQSLPKFHAPFDLLFKSKFQRTFSGKIIRKP